MWAVVMTRSSVISRICLAAALCAPALPVGRAAAQVTAGTGGRATQSTGAIIVLLTKVGTREFDQTQTLVQPVGAQDCDDKAELEFTLNGVPNSFSFLEVWLGPGNDAACNQGDRSTQVVSQRNCRLLATRTLTTGETMVTGLRVPIEQACELGSGDWNFWFLPTNSQNSQSDVATYGKLSVRFDTLPPDPPANVKGATGFSALRVTWTIPSGDPYYYHVLVDTSAAAGGDADGGNDSETECSSSILEAGQPRDLDDLPSAIRKYDVGRETRLEIDGRELNSERAAVAIIADDLARNHSVMSNVACLSIVETKGFWPSYIDNGGTVEPGCGCSVPGASPGSSSAALGCVAFGLIALLRRARRRR
jgi:MYXO-CTERM domain-containing protein